MRFQAPLDDLLRGPSHVRVLRALNGLPVGWSASTREIARRAGLSHPTASKVLTSLLAQGIVVRTRGPRANAFELRRKHTASRQLAALFEWEERLPHELVSYLRTGILSRMPSMVRAAVLFGSAVKGEMTAASDIDVAVLHTKGTTDPVTAAMEEIGEGVRERFGNRLSVVLSDRPLNELQKARSQGFRLWRRILREGMPILDAEAEMGDG